MRTVLLLLALATAALAADVKVPAEVRVKPGRLAKVAATSDSPSVIRYLNVHDDLDLIESETGRWAVITSTRPGRYKIGLYSDAGGPPAYCVVVVEGGVPPAPTPTPTPPGPAPAPAGPLRVLIVYESAELAKMPEAQRGVLFSAKVREYLNAKCGPDEGGTKSWRIWDKDTDASADAKHWPALLARPRPAVPYIHVLRGESPVHEGPLPATVGETLALLLMHGG